MISDPIIYILMPDNFFISAERMHDSSQKLHETHHYHNACYLAGYVGECYLKILIMKALSHRQPRQYGHKIHEMDVDLQYASTNMPTIGSFRHYLINMASDCPNIHAWNPGKRYDDSSGWETEIASQSFQEEQKKCFHQVATMFVAGIIP